MLIPVEHVLAGDELVMHERVGTVIVDRLAVYDSQMLPPSPELTRVYVVLWRRGNRLGQLRPLTAGSLLAIIRADPEPGPDS